MGTNDLWKRQLVMNLLISPNFVQSNDVLVNLITNVNFLGFLDVLKVASFSNLHDFSLYDCITKN
jgi:hypothetical protein